MSSNIQILTEGAERKLRKDNVVGGVGGGWVMVLWCYADDCHNSLDLESVDFVF